MCATPDDFHPFQSTIDIDGSKSDREIIQDIAYDGETLVEIRKLHKKQKIRKTRRPIEVED